MRYLALFAAIIATTPLAVDMYLPAMIQIAETFDAPITQIQNSLSIYLAGYAFGMFLFGPLADKLGRRPLVIAGLSGFIIFSILLTFCQSADIFLSLRFFQAMTGGAATVVIPGAIRQLMGKDTAKGLSYVSMIMMVAPMLAPAIGGLLLAVQPWPLIFHVLAAYGTLMLFAAWRWFPNLEQDPTRSPLQQSFIKRYHTVLKEKSCHPFLAVTMLSSLVFFTYITSVSFLYIDFFEFSETQFSLLFGLNVVGLICANFINTRLVPKLGSRKILHFAAFFALLLASAFFCLILINAAPALIIACLIPLLGNLVVISANSDALILRQFVQHGGTAAAVIGTLRFSSGALAGPLLALLFDQTALPIGIIFGIGISSMSVILWMGLANQTHPNKPQDATPSSTS
ncbi:multidrug effflux MFS transporter [Aliikangiella sp. IMCC44632]